MKDHRYLNIASEDIEASNLLLEKKLFPQALYNTEQAVEKVCKYIILKDEILTEKQLKKQIGHNSLKVYEILTNYFQKQIRDNSPTNSYKHEFNESLVDLLKQSDIFLEKTRHSNIKTTMDKDYDNILRLLDYLKEIGGHYSTKYNVLFKSPEAFIQAGIDFKFFDEETIKILSQMYSKKDSREQAIDIAKNILNEAPLYQNLSLRLITLAKIFTSHLEKTRYPDLDKNSIPSEIFNESNSLIVRLDRFNMHILEIITGLKNINI